MPPYRLQIRQNLRIQDPLARFLDRHEVIRNRRFRQSLVITNIGDETFPGGSIKLFKLSDLEGRGVSKRAAFRLTSNLVNRLGPGESQEVGSFVVRLEWEGLTRVRLQIEADDNQLIEYYYSKRGKPRTNDWSDIIQVVNKELLLILDLLEKQAPTER